MSHKDNIEKAVKVNLGDENVLRWLINIAYDCEYIWIDSEGEMIHLDSDKSLRIKN